LIARRAPPGRIAALGQDAALDHPRQHPLPVPLVAVVELSSPAQAFSDGFEEKVIEAAILAFATTAAGLGAVAAAEGVKKWRRSLERVTRS